MICYEYFLMFLNFFSILLRHSFIIPAKASSYSHQTMGYIIILETTKNNRMITFSICSHNLRFKMYKVN